MSTGGKAPGTLPEAEQHAAEQLERRVAAMQRDRAHVPDHRTPGVEIGGDDEKPSAALMRGGDVGKKRRRDLFGDQLAQRPGVEETLARAADLENIGS